MKKAEHTSIRTMRTLLIMIAATIATVVACTDKDNYRADHGVPPCEYTEELNNLFAPIFPDNEPGAIVTVMRNDSIIYNHAFGLARLDSICRVTDSTLFNIASSSKIFCSAALLKLSEQGLISLDDSLAKFFPEFEAPFFKEIRVRDILTHSSGLPDVRPRNNESWNNYLAKHNSAFGEESDYKRYSTEAEHIQFFEDLDTVALTPSSHYLRSDPAFVLVAPLIERITGHSFDEWMADNLFKPAGMTDTRYFNAGDLLPRASHGYRCSEGKTTPGVFRSSDGKWEEYDYGEVDFFLTKADRGAFSSARDFMRWNKALYSGKIISRALVDSINTGYIPSDIPYVSYGLANAVAQKPGRPLKIYHANTNGGYGIVEATIPSENISYLIFSTRANWDLIEVFEKVDSILLKL